MTRSSSFDVPHSLQAMRRECSDPCRIKAGQMLDVPLTAWRETLPIFFFSVWNWNDKSAVLYIEFGLQAAVLGREPENGVEAWCSSYMSFGEDSQRSQDIHILLLRLVN